MSKHDKQHDKQTRDNNMTKHDKHHDNNITKTHSRNT